MQLGVLFCDQVDSTALLTRLGDALAEEIRRDLFQALQQAADLARGEVVKGSGDGLMVIFRSGPADALLCGELMIAKVARLASREQWSQVALRVGVSYGEAVFDQGDWYGAVVNLAARLCAAAAPGQLLASSEAVNTLGPAASAAGWESLPSLTLKGFPDRVAVMARQIADGRPTAPLPVELDLAGVLPLVGRADPIRELDDAFTEVAAGGKRIVDVVGSPGAGVSRVLAEFANRSAGNAVVLYAHADGDWIEQLVRCYAALASADDLCAEAGSDAAALARTCALVGLRLDVRPAPDPQLPAEQLVLRLLARVANRLPVLVLLDGVAVNPALRAGLPERVLVVSGARAEFGQQLGSAIVLAALAVSDVGALLDTAAPTGAAWRADLDALVFAETDGLPRDIAAVVDELIHESADGQLRPSAAVDAVRRAIPYKGLQVFSDEDAVRFHGRTRAVSEVMDGLAAHAFVAVVGSSGSGKSSVVRAGCAPLLAAEGSTLIVLTPGEDPLRTLAVAWCRALGGDPTALHERLQQDPTALARMPNPSENVVLLVDQLEECFTLCSDDAARDQFLRAITHPVISLRAIATLRGDYFGRASEHQELAEALRVGTVLMTPPNQAELRTIIEAPAGGAHLRLEPGLSDQILGDITDRPGGLPLLSHALRETWRRRRSRTLTITDYADAGRATGAIARTADAVFEQLTPGEQQAAKRIFLRLTALGEGSEDSRRRVPIATLLEGATAESQRVLQTLTAARLVTADTDAEGRDVDELAHEALLREWPRLRGWLDEDRDELRDLAHLEAAAQEWQRSGQPDSELYTERRLEAAESISADKLNDRERAYLSASVAMRNTRRRAARRSRRRLQSFVVVLVVLLVIASIAGIVAVKQRGQARTSARNAQQQTRVATASDLTAQAQAQLATQPGLAALLAVEGEKAQDSQQARAALFSTVYGDPHLARFATGFGQDLGDLQLNGIQVPRFALSPDGRLASVVGTDGASIRVFDFRTVTPTTPSLSLGGAPVQWAVWSANHELAVLFTNRRIAVWDGNSGKRLVTITIPSKENLNPGAGLVLSPNGKILVLDSFGDGSILRWSITSGKPIGRPIDPGSFGNLTFSPDGSRIAFGDKNGIDIIDPLTARPLQPALKVDVGFDLSYTANGRELLITNEGGAPFVVDAHTGKTLRTLKFPANYSTNNATVGIEDNPTGDAISPDGRYVAFIDQAGTLIIWRTSDGSVVGGEAFTNAARGFADSLLYFTPDSKQLVFGNDQDIFTWNLSPKGLLPAGEINSSSSGIGTTTFVDRKRNRVIVVGDDQRLRVYDSRSLKLISISPPLKFLTQFPTFALDPATGSLAYLVEPSFTKVTGIAFIDPLDPDKVQRTPETMSGQPVGLSFSPDGRQLAVSLNRFATLNAVNPDGGYLQIIELSGTRQPPPVTRLDPDGAADGGSGLEWTPDGSQVLFVGSSDLLTVDSTTGHVLASQPLPQTNHCCVSAFAAGQFVGSAKSELFASFNQDDLITFHSADKARHQLPTLASGAGGSLDVSPDVGLLAEGENPANTTGGALDVWSLPSGKRLISAVPYQGSVDFLSDQSLLVVGSEISALSLNPQQLVGMACSIAGRNLTRAEFSDFLGSMPYHRTCPEWPAGS